MNVAARSLILDLDGTLIDSCPGVLESFGVAAREILPGRALDPDKVMIGPPLRRMFQAAFPGVTDAQADALVIAFRRYYESEGALNTRLFDGAAEVLAECARRGLELRIATNKPHRISTMILARLKVDSFFRAVVAIDSVEPPFPSKTEMLRHVLQNHRLIAAETIYVGDSMEDCAAAAENGLRFIFAAYGYGTLAAERAPQAHRTIRSLRELPAALD